MVKLVSIGVSSVGCAAATPRTIQTRGIGRDVSANLSEASGKQKAFNKCLEDALRLEDPNMTSPVDRVPHDALSPSLD